MTARVHGYNMTNRLGYLIGDNAFVSFATNAADVEVKATGVITPLQQFKELYAYDPTKDIAVNVTKTVDVDAAGNPITVTEPNVSADLRTINGVVYASDATYVAAWAAQENMKRLVDVIQQRAIVLGISAAAAVNSAITGVTTGRAYGQWSTTMTAAATNNFVTFMVERGYVFDKTRPNSYGQPGGTVIGQELLDELAATSLLNATGTAVPLTATSVGVRIDREIPRII